MVAPYLGPGAPCSLVRRRDADQPALRRDAKGSNLFRYPGLALNLYLLALLHQPQATLADVLRQNKVGAFFTNPLTQQDF